MPRRSAVSTRCGPAVILDGSNFELKRIKQTNSIKSEKVKMADENVSPQERARAAMIARASKGKKVPVKSPGVIAAENEAALKRANAPKGKKNLNKNQTPASAGGGGSMDSGHCDC